MKIIRRGKAVFTSWKQKRLRSFRYNREYDTKLSGGIFVEFWVVQNSYWQVLDSLEGLIESSISYSKLHFNTTGQHLSKMKLSLGWVLKLASAEVGLGHKVTLLCSFSFFLTLHYLFYGSQKNHAGFFFLTVEGFPLFVLFWGAP